MKLRTRGQSLRLRLTRGEIAALEGGAPVTTTLTLGPLPEQRLTYAVEASAGVDAMTLRYTPGALTIQIPAAALAGWGDDERVGFEGTQRVAEGVEVSMVVEKDFQCLRPRAGGDDDDTFPHPRQGEETC